MKRETHTSSHIQIELGDVAYIELPGFKEAEKVSKTISLGDIVQDLKSQADIDLDFSADGVLIGIEILSIINPDHQMER